jgi:5-formyltetrahydrofolate cyclo-ligase
MNSSLTKVYKSLLRAKLRKQVAQIPAAEMKKKSRRIANQLFQTRAFKNARIICVYMALPSEVHTDEIVKKALSQRKKVFIPCIASGKKLTLKAIFDPKKGLRKNNYGILESSQSSLKGNPAELDLVVVPGLGFDRHRNRLGRGMGYFDRFLHKTTKAQKIGLAFREQILKDIPTESHDLKVDQVITD